MNSKQQKIVESFVKENQSFINRIQQEINRYEQTDDGTWCEKERNARYEFDVKTRMLSNRKKELTDEWAKVPKEKRGNLKEIISNDKDVQDMKRKIKYLEVQIPIYHSAFYATKGIKATLKYNLDNLIEEYFRQFLSENKDYFKFKLSSKTYEEMFNSVLPVTYESMRFHITTFESHNGATSFVFKFHDDARRGNYHFVRNFLISDGNLKCPEKITIVPYNAIVKAAMSLYEDNKRIDELKRKYESAVHEINKKYENMRFGTCFKNIY